MKDSNSIQIKDCKLLVDSNEVIIKGKVVKLTPKEKDVLLMLHFNKGNTVTRTQILENVWGDAFGNDSGLTQSISKLRRVFKDDPKQPRFIKTIPKLGYKLLAESHSNGFYPVGKFRSFYKINRWFGSDHFNKKIIMMLVLVIIFLLIFNVNIRIESIPI